MYDIHAKANAIRAEGLCVKIPFDSRVLAASNSTITNVMIGTRKDLRNIIKGFFRTLRSDWIMLGLLDPSTGGTFTVGNSGEYLGVSKNQDLCEQLLDDLWLVPRSIFEHHVSRDPDFLKLCTDFINWAAYMQLEKKLCNRTLLSWGM